MSEKRRKHFKITFLAFWNGNESSRIRANEKGPGFYKTFLVTLVRVESSGKRGSCIRVTWINSSIREN